MFSPSQRTARHSLTTPIPVKARCDRPAGALGRSCENMPESRILSAFSAQDARNRQDLPAAYSRSQKSTQDQETSVFVLLRRPASVPTGELWCASTETSQHRLPEQAVVRRPPRIRGLSRQKRRNPPPHVIHQDGSTYIHDSALSIMYVASFPDESVKEYTDCPRNFKSRCQRALSR